MPSTLEETGKHKVKLTVEVPANEFSKDLGRTYQRISQQAKVPGFRKGKVPRPIIDAQFGRGYVLEQFLKDALPSYYEEAVREHELAPIAEPELSLEKVEEGSPLVFTAEVEVRPRLELDKDVYEGVRVEKPSIEVSEAEIDEYLLRLRERFAELEVVGHPARRGDFVIADVRAEVHGQEVPEASRQELLYEIGSNQLVPKLDEELEGKRKGEILQFNAVLPEQFGDRAGEEVSFRVLIKEVKAKKLPAADDEFAKTASEFDTLVELRDDIRARVRQAKEREAEAEIRRRVLDELIDRTEVELPDRLVDNETDHRVEQAEQRAQRIGMTLEQVLEAQGWDELRLRSDARAHSIRALKGDMILEAVARKEGLTVTSEELSESVVQLSQALGRDPKDVARTLERTGQIGSLAGDIIRNKALDLLVERAEVIDLEAPVKAQGTSAEGTSEESTNT